MSGLTGIHVAWICGWLTVIGVPAPYARAEVVDKTIPTLAEQVAGIKQTVQDDRVESIDSKIIEIRSHQCKAASDDAKQAWEGQLNGEMNKYFSLTHQWDRVPACDEL